MANLGPATNSRIQTQVITYTPLGAPATGRIVAPDPERRVAYIADNPDQGDATITFTAIDASYDWVAHDGVLQSDRRPADKLTTSQSRLYYFRPLQNGDSLSYEFRHEPGQFEVHPAIGRLAFLLEPDGVRVHWMTATGHEWTGLPDNNAVIEPRNRRGPRSLPFKPGDWNTMTVSLTDDTVTLKLNDTVIYARQLEGNLRRTFGFYHDQTNSGASIRNVVLRGDWPERLGPEHHDNLLALAGQPHNEVDRQTLGILFNDEHIGDAALTVHRRAMQMPIDARYEYLAEWVLPGVDHDTIRVALDFTPTHPALPVREVDPLDKHRLEVAGAEGQSRVQIGGNLISPALDLIAVARELGKLDEVKQRVEQASPKHEQQIQARVAMLALIYAGQSDFTAANKHLDELCALVETDVSTDFASRWPESLAVWVAMHDPATRELARELAVLLYERQLRPNRQSGVAAWEIFVRAMIGQARFFDVPEGESRNPTLQRYWTSPKLREWDPASRTTARSRGQGFARAHWQLATDGVTNHSSHETDFLYYHIPLQGNYQVECDLDAFRGRDTSMSVGGTWLLTAYNQAAFTFGGYRTQRGRLEINPKLTRIRFQLHFRAVIEDGTYRAFINGREVHAEILPQPFDPWIAIQSRERHDGGVSNLRITGDPVIPDVILMTASSTLAGWLPYYGASIGGKGRHWRQRGDIPGGGGIVGTHRPALSISHVERLLRYHRPMLEDGSIEYEFYYRDGVSLVHPVLDRLALILAPQGVRIHWITDGAFDRTGLAADNVADEPENRRGPEVLPLKPNAWNHLRLALMGDTVELFLNEQLVYQRQLEITNQRTFGLFHYANRTEARVRFMKWRGDWPRELPAVRDQELAGQDASFLDERLPELTAVFQHDFATGGLDTSRFSLVYSADGGALTNQPAGLQVIRPGGAKYQATCIAPSLAVRGNFDISASFEQFETQVTAASQAIVMLQLLMTGKSVTESAINRRHARSAADVEQQLVVAAANERSNGESRRRQLANGPGESPAGVFRIARRGDRIYYLYAESDKASFRVLAVDSATTDDIGSKAIRLITQTNGSAHAAVVWKSITVRAEKLLQVTDPNNPEPGLLWVMNADGTELRKITEPNTEFNNHGSPAWSPDGTKVAFDDWGGIAETSRIFVVSADGSGLKDLGIGTMPTFSADGEKIAFTWSGHGMTIMNADGSDREVLDRNGWGVQWSPDGRALAYGIGGNITVLDLKTKEKRTILEGEHASRYDYTHWNLAWSRDSQRVCFKGRKRSSKESDVVVAAVAGSSKGFEVLYTSPPDMQPDFAWHPDGDRILFSMNSPDGRTVNLFVVSRKKPGKAELWPQQPDMKIQGIDWSRDGRQIVFKGAKQPDWQSRLDELPPGP